MCRYKQLNMPGQPSTSPAMCGYPGMYACMGTPAAHRPPRRRTAAGRPAQDQSSARLGVSEPFSSCQAWPLVHPALHQPPSQAAQAATLASDGSRTRTACSPLAGPTAAAFLGTAGPGGKVRPSRAPREIWNTPCCSGTPRNWYRPQCLMKICAAAASPGRWPATSALPGSQGRGLWTACQGSMQVHVGARSHMPLEKGMQCPVHVVHMHR